MAHTNTGIEQVGALCYHTASSSNEKNYRSESWCTTIRGGSSSLASEVSSPLTDPNQMIRISYLHFLYTI